MTQNQLIAVAGIVIPCATATLVGYWHRKQIQQVELFRHDPSVGVLPPPSPPVAFFKRYCVPFFKRYWDVILGVGLPMLNVAFSITRNEPVTIKSVVIISFNFAAIVHCLRLRSERQILELIHRQAEALFEQAEALLEQAKLSSVIVKTSEAQMRLIELERQKGLKEIAQNTGEAHPNTSLI